MLNCDLKTSLNSYLHVETNLIEAIFFFFFLSFNSTEISRTKKIKPSNKLGVWFLSNQIS